MQKLLLALSILLLISLPVSGQEAFFEGHGISIHAFLGWELLDPEETYVFTNHFYGIDYMDFIFEQHDALERIGADRLNPEQMKELFGDKLVPLILSMRTSLDFTGYFYITTVSGRATSFRGGHLVGWEREYATIPKSVGAYYFLNDVPPLTTYELIFLIPKEVAEDLIVITFHIESERHAIVVDGRDQDVQLRHRIDYLQWEIERLQGLLNERKDE